MDERQQRIWKRMIEATQGFLDGSISLSDMVRVLESSMDAAELEDKELEHEFYRRFVPLEEHRACSVELGASVTDKLARANTEKMQSFLLSAGKRFGIDDVIADFGD